MSQSSRFEGILWSALLLLVASSARLLAADAQWELNGDLESSTGQAALTPLAASPAVDPEVTFETATIGGQDAEVAHFTQGTYFDVPHGLGPNGGGGYVNQYTLILDVMFPDRSPSGNVTSLLQTNCCNQNDGDWFIGAEGGLGTLGTFGGAVADGEWHRLALVVDLTVGTLASYVDGVKVQESAGEVVDGRYSLYSPTDTDPDPYATFFIFADDSGENSEGYVNSIQFHDIALDAGVLAEIGGPSAAGIPRNVCIFPPAVATRDILTTRSAAETNGDFVPGDVLGVEVALSDLRVAAGSCTAPAGVVLVEKLPGGWIPSAISDGGAFDNAQGSISWTLTGGAFTAGKKVTYQVTSAAVAGLSADFVGTIAENLVAAKPSPVRGESQLLTDVPFDACGGIRCWNILGAYQQPFGASPGDDNLRLDYLTDGETFEPDFLFFPGAQIATLFGGDGQTGAASSGILGGTAGHNPDGLPTVIAWNDRDGYVNLNDDVFGGNPDNVMAYAQAYVTNTTGAPLEVRLGISSDDSVQVILNGTEIWLRSLGRAGADACSPQDVTPDGVLFTEPHVLDPGENSLLVKVWEGGGGWNFAVRFQDEAGNPITSGLQVSKRPASICTVVPLVAARTIATPETVTVQHETRPRWKPGDTYDVSIALSDIRTPSATCPASTTVTIEERVPAGWTPSAPSSGGVIAGEQVTWTLSGAAIAPGTLTYKVKTGDGTGDVVFRGRISEAPADVRSAVSGQSTLSNPSSFTGGGFLKSWLLLGPYRRPLASQGPSPGEAAIRQDYLAEAGGVTEKTDQPRDGDVVNTDYRGAARSIGLAEPASPVAINAGGVPTWKAWRDLDDTILFDHYYGGNIDQVMMYAVTYLDVAEDLTVDLGVASDDSIQVILDATEIWINNVARGFDVSETIQDIVPGLQLTAGRHRLMVKVFDGVGEHGFRLRFQDDTGAPVTEGITVCLDPECADQTPAGTTFHRGDADANGEIQLTDAVRVLNYLFLGQGTITCFDAADADDNGEVQLTDAVRVLNYLFLGTGTIPAPGPADGCLVDPTEDPLDCVEYAPCQ